MAEGAKKKRGKGNENSGMKFNQKMKSYLVLHWMKKNTDRFHTMTAEDIAEHISGKYGVAAERRSIYRDIDAINQVVLLEHGEAKTIKKAIELVDDGEKTIAYDTSKRGYYYDNLFCDFEDIKLAAECIYGAKFIDKERADKIIEELICKDISIYQKEDITTDIFVSDRVRTTDKHLWNTIEIIREAMKHRTEDDEEDRKKYKHRPEQISFQYLTHTLSNVENQIERGKGAEYVVSPHRLMVCDGNYYLLAYNAKAKRNKVRTYRIDRMRNVKRIKGSECEGSAEVKEIDLKTYTQTHFNMFEGDSELVTIRFTNDLLDAAIERFGTKNARYAMFDKKHFTVTTRINVSNPFYGWVFGFGKKAKILKPQRAVDEMREIVHTLMSMYEPEETE